MTGGASSSHVRSLAYLSAWTAPPTSASRRAPTPSSCSPPRSSASRSCAPAAEIRSFGLHTLLSKRNRAAARAAGLAYTVHGPFGYTGIWDLDDTSGSRRWTSIAATSRPARRSGRDLYVAHPDWRPDLAPRDPAVVAALDRSFDTLLEWQDEYGVEIVVENMPGAGSRTSRTPATSICMASASSWTWVTPVSAAAWMSGWPTRGRRCATCTCTITTARATTTTPP